MDNREHWEEVWRKKAPSEVSWYQADPTRSLSLILSCDLPSEAKIIDVGGGASLLIDRLLEKGFTNLTLLDISLKALQVARERLGARAAKVRWWVSDITQAKLPPQFKLWHDRAVFHFLTEVEARQKYLQVLNRALKVGGYLIMATFALDGPPKCSGLEVRRYSPQTLQQELGENFVLVSSSEETHLTPQQMPQKFIYCCFQKVK